jgi:uncharacterized membrane protein YccC
MAGHGDGVAASAATFSRFIPEVKARYDYGVTIFILTFSLVAVSSYRVEELIRLAHQRFSTIAIGVATCLFTAIFVCPVWAGEDLHNLAAANLDKLADFLEGTCSARSSHPIHPKRLLEYAERTNRIPVHSMSTMYTSSVNNPVLL